MKVLAATVGSRLNSRRVDTRLIIFMVVFAVLMIVLPTWLAVQDMRNSHAAEQISSEAQRIVGQVEELAASLQQLLVDPQTQSLALLALAEPAKLADLTAHLSARIPQIKQARVVPMPLWKFRPAEVAGNGFALQEMMMMAQGGQPPPLQMHPSLRPPMLVDVSGIKKDEVLAGFLVIEVEPGYVLARFNPNLSGNAYSSISQNNGRQAAATLKSVGNAPPAGTFSEKLPVSGTLFRIEVPLPRAPGFLSASVLVVALVLGLLLMVAAVILYRLNKQWVLEHPRPMAADSPNEPLPEAAPTPESKLAAEKTSLDELPPAARRSAAPSRAVELPDPPPMRLRYDIQEKHKPKADEMHEVELTVGIFRAYDMRGIIGKTLDAGVAIKVGRVLGTLALEKSAGPMVVARDGRLSGPELVAGMIEGITASGCDVLDIGAVPTGVLYFAAHELAKGSGVMITGSHNPPDYNGFKVMVAGDTLYGPQIKDIYRRIIENDVRSGAGKVERKDVLLQYRKRISSDIKLERPLRVVIDCGNGIGGVCAADVLRDIGAEVLPLFDEVDGTFPNHHPDPSEPHNLKDLIESVRLMDADIGLALDGDADRLGVVTLGGSIIYPDRVMMLLAMDVLDRVPGATIIYDVKCTGHLAKVIEQAGGKAIMYKTGHSLIKAKMKEIGSPFAGEMSGHFFFGERWYGVDDGIYAAARLLEILASAEAPPEAILNALPTSFSTPELKVEMREGENHVFIDTFQAKASFPGARVSTIDGVRADFEDGWGLVRASNTTPIIVVRFDGETEAALKRIKNLFRARMLAINPDLNLPF
jgi:phosphomannomutase/phosphoglucomutase